MGEQWTFGITYDMAKQVDASNPVAGFRPTVYGADIAAAWNVFVPALLCQITGYGSGEHALKLALESVYTAGKLSAQGIDVLKDAPPSHALQLQ